MRSSALDVRTGLFAAIAVTAAAAGCGGEQKGFEPAPVPEAWRREDRGGDRRPPSTVIGEPAPAEGAGGDAGPGGEAARRERELRGELQSRWERIWRTTPGPARAERICDEHTDVGRLVDGWLSKAQAAVGPQSRAELARQAQPLHDLMREIDELCTAEDPRLDPEPVEGRFQGISHEVEVLGSWLDARTRP